MSQNLLCNQFANLIHQRKLVEIECENLRDAIKDEKLKKSEKVKENQVLNLPEFYNEFIEKLLEYLEILKLFAYDLGKESFDIQGKIEIVEKLVDIQEDVLAELDEKNSFFERETNEKIHDIREQFVQKYSELTKSKKLYTETENFLQESLEELKQLNREFKIKKQLLAKYNCCIEKLKSQQEGEEIKLKYENLKATYDKITKKVEGLESILKCYREKMCRIQHELDLTTKIFRRKLNVVKEHDLLSFEQLLKRKKFIEGKIQEISGEKHKEDVLIKKLRINIDVLIKSINESENSIDKLEKYMDFLHEHNLSGRRYLKLSKSAFKPDKNLIFGRDYMGGTFVTK